MTKRILHGQRPLTDAQERALIDAANAERDTPGEWHKAKDLEFGWKPATWNVLHELGLVNVKYSQTQMFREGDWLVRITTAGLDLCNSMGD